MKITVTSFLLVIVCSGMVLSQQKIIPGMSPHAQGFSPSSLPQDYSMCFGFNMKLWMSNRGCTGINARGDGRGGCNWFGLEYPPDSNIEHLFGAGLWIGARTDTGRGQRVIGVTVTYEGWSGTLFEMYGNPDGSDSFFVTSIEQPNGANRKGYDDDGDGFIDEDEYDAVDNDNDGSTDEDYGALAHSDASVAYTDTVRSPVIPGHVPLGIKIWQKSYAWRTGTSGDAILIFDYTIVNVGQKRLDSVYLAYFADADVGPLNSPGYYTRNSAAYDALTHTAYVVNPEDYPSTPIGFTVLGGSRSVDSLKFTFRWFPGYETPPDDVSKYDFMSTGVVMPDEYPSISDTRILLSVGPFRTVNPGDTLRYVIGIVSGSNILTMLNNAERAKRIYESGYFIMPVTSIRYDYNSRSAIVSWDAVSRSPYGNVTSYRVYYGINSEQFTDSATTTELFFEFTNLDSGDIVYYSVAAVDERGNRGALSSEVDLQSRVYEPPLVNIISGPSDTVYILKEETETWGGIGFSFRGRDRNSRNIEYSWKVDTQDWSEWSFSTQARVRASDIDMPYTGQHEFSVRARNEFGIITPDELHAKRRFYTVYPAFADSGYPKRLLYVNATRSDSRNLPYAPDVNTFNEFYRVVLDSIGVEYDMWNTARRGHPNLSTMGRYTTIYIVTDICPPANSQRIPGRKYSSYLDVGGKIIMNGIHYPGIPLVVNDAESLLISRMYLDYSYYGYRMNTRYDFVGAYGENGYPDVTLDNTKLDSLWGGALRYISVSQPRGLTEIIFRFNSKSDSIDFEQMPMGYRYMGPTYKTAFYGFPLYFLPKDQAIAILRKTLTDFEEIPLSVTEHNTRPQHYYLSYAYPNPFNPVTSIQYAVPSTQYVSLKVYDVLGQEVAVLVNEELKAGTYSVQWDASALASGVYFYKITAGSFHDVKKMVLMR
jgi:hypothetical protein